MIGLYAMMVKTELSVNIIIISFGLFVSATTSMVMLKHRANQRKYDSVALIGEHKH
jgi:hypothetical protein